ncbi:GntR family transcriptional regulator [Aureimonas frigidaquae]|uniref:GntR family transcriptional regulator n=1 Tax=Aureimonas frigidaquae TaxID=424757 RepID=UPI000782A69E|nr:GntR family transcriptional regulator [Aureimonas frigidaquae]
MREPIERKSIQDQAVEWLRQGIVRGEFAPGSTLTELSLAERIGTSRSTVRSALFTLEGQELVSRSPYSSWRVAELTAQAIWEIYTLRAAYEGLAGRILAARRGEFGTERVERAFAALAAAEGSGTDARVFADLSFHASFVQQIRHQHLIRRHALLADKMEWLYRWSESHWPCRNPLVAEHRPLFEALVRGSPADAEQAVRDHIDYSITEDLAGFHRLNRTGSA